MSPHPPAQPDAAGIKLKKPWMPLYVGEYLAKTSHLSTIQHGAYLLLIMHYWANGGLPTTDKELMAIARMDADEWSGNCYAIAKFFSPTWRHHRIDEELCRAKNISEHRSLAGLKGAWVRHGKINGESWQLPTQSHSHSRKRPTDEN